MIASFKKIRKLPNAGRERAYEADREALLRKLESVTLFSELDDTKEDRIRKGAAPGAEGAFYFAKTYLSHHFSAESWAEWHHEAIEANQIVEQPVSVTGHRAGGKSTITDLLEPIRDAVYMREEFVVINAKSFERGELYTMRILTELQHNPRIKEDFGEIVRKNAGVGDFATRRSRERPKRVRFMAWGDGMSMRGLVSENSRPTKIICVDLQDREAAENPKRTRKLLEKIKGDWLGATAQRGWKFIVEGNIICSGSIIDRLQKEETAWKHFKWPVEYIDAFGVRRSAWPEMFPLEKLDKMRQQMGDGIYEAEMLCEPREVDAAFDERWFRHFKELPKKLKPRRTFIVLDPSLSETGDNKGMFAMNPHRHRVTDEDYTTLVDGRGKLYDQNLYHFILRCYNRQATIVALLEEMYVWDEYFDRPLFFIDGTFGQKRIFLKYLGEWAVKKKRRLKVYFYSCKTDKTRRILAIQPDIQSGTIVFPPAEGPYAEDTKETIRQFIRLGKPGMKDDGPDAIAAGIERSDKILHPGSVG